MISYLIGKRLRTNIPSLPNGLRDLVDSPGGSTSTAPYPLTSRKGDFQRASSARSVLTDNVTKSHSSPTAPQRRQMQREAHSMPSQIPLPTNEAPGGHGHGCEPLRTLTYPQVLLLGEAQRRHLHRVVPTGSPIPSDIYNHTHCCDDPTPFSSPTSPARTPQNHPNHDAYRDNDSSLNGKPRVRLPGFEEQFGPSSQFPPVPTFLLPRQRESIVNTIIESTAARIPPPPPKRQPISSLASSSLTNFPLDPMNVVVYPASLFIPGPKNGERERREATRRFGHGLVAIPPLRCCDGRCNCPLNECGCRESCDGGCVMALDRREMGHQVASCCAQTT